MRIAPDLLDEIIAHARDEYDAECCGLIAYAPADPGGGDEHDPGDPDPSDPDGRDERFAVSVHRATNTFASRKRFEIDGRELLRTINEFEDAGWELGAIYHSHTHTAPYPSQTDINFASGWPGLEWVIVGLAGDVPEVRSYLIEDGLVREVELEVDAT